MNYPFQVLSLLFRHDNKLSALFAFRKLAGLLHNIENENLIFVDEFPKVVGEACHSLGGQGLGSLGEDNGDLKATIEGASDDAHKGPRLPSLDLAQEHSGAVARRGRVLKLLHNPVDARRQGVVIFPTFPQPSVKACRH